MRGTIELNYRDFETLHACLLCETDRLRKLDASVNVCECESCGYVFDNPRPTVEALTTFYSQPSKYDSWISEEQARTSLWNRRLKQLLRVRTPGSLLDVGAGIGQFLHLAQPHFREVAGIEISASAIDIAQKKYGLRLIRGEIQAIDFSGKQFDNITIFHVLEHVPNPKLVVERCAQLLNKGGTLVIAVPNELQSLRMKARKLLGRMGVRKFQKISKSGLPKIVLDGSLGEIHLSHFTPDVLRGLVERSGLSVVSDSLDPYYVATGFGKWKERMYYLICSLLRPIVQMNVYDTILLVARKVGA
jgi:SAM-dependent methyltransferase